MTFVIDAENNITAYTPDTAPSGTEVKLSEESFGSEKELAALAGTWPGARLIEIWNSLPGATPVKKFTDRKSAVARIWKSIQSLTPAPETETTEAATKAIKGKKAAHGVKEKPVKATKAKPAKEPGTARDGSKKAVILELLEQKGGATLGEIMTATGWQAHSVRGFISGHLGKKLGFSVDSSKNNTGERVYRISR